MHLIELILSTSRCYGSRKARSAHHSSKLSRWPSRDPAGPRNYLPEVTAVTSKSGYRDVKEQVCKCDEIVTLADALISQSLQQNPPLVESGNRVSSLLYDSTSNSSASYGMDKETRLICIHLILSSLMNQYLNKSYWKTRKTGALYCGPLLLKMPRNDPDVVLKPVGFA